MPTIYCLIHTDYELPGSIETWAHQNGYPFHIIPVFSGFSLPVIEPNDCIVVMGGPMNVYEADKYPWLRDEKALLARHIGTGNRMLGICLGAQLLAEQLGAIIVRNSHLEIGWHAIQWTDDMLQSTIFDGLAPEPVVFHWHGDMFEIPPNAIPLAKSDACPNQGFLWNSQVLGLQFHPEITPDLLNKMISGNKEDLNNTGPFIQSAEDMLMESDKYIKSPDMLDIILDRFLKTEIDA